MKDTEELIQALLAFRNDRDWEQFHDPKDLALEAKTISDSV
jgi:hypothetical protein